jgi:hypothetical protein
MPEPISLLLTTFAGAAGKASATEGARVLRQLVGLQEAQLTLLRALDVKVDALLAGPFGTGSRQLRDALVEGRDPGDRDRLLRDARASFTQALGQDTDHLRRSLAALHLGAVWVALGSKLDVGGCQLTLTDIITDQGFYDGLGIQLVARNEDGALWTRSLDSNVETSIRLTDEQPVTLAATYDEYLFATKTRCKALIERTLLGHVPPLPTLGVAETKYHIRVALNRRFGAAYRDGYAKKVTGCYRRSRTRVRCEHVSWVVGDVSFAGKATIWLTREDGEPFWTTPTRSSVRTSTAPAPAAATARGPTASSSCRRPRQIVA